MTSQALVSYFWCSQTFSTFTQYMSVSHGYSTIGGIEYGGCGEDKKKEIVSHQLGISTGYGDAHCRCQNRRISGRGSRTMCLGRMVTGDKGHEVLPRFGPS